MLVSLLALALAAPLPASLRETGIDAAQVQAFSPQYPLWSDGSAKRRWVALPPGASIDARDADAWLMPPGAKFWKEFALDGRPVETRYIARRADGGWDFGSYVWNAEGTEAVLAPARGTTARDGRYAVPSRGDCMACHGDGAGGVKILGFSALQLSPDRDPMAPHATAATGLDLRALQRAGLLKGEVPAAPRIAADTPVERAALGYLHANCSHCHNSSGTQVPVLLDLAQSVRDPEGSRRSTLASLRATARYGCPQGWAAPSPPPAGGKEAWGGPALPCAAVPAHALLAQRMQSRDARVQMPPLGTQIPDSEGLALVLRWLNSSGATPEKSR